MISNASGNNQADICPNNATTQSMFNISQMPANTIPTDLSDLNHRKMTAAYKSMLSRCITQGSP